MKAFMKVVLFFSGLALSVAGAAALLYKFFKKHCVIHIEFNPAEENACACDCDEEGCEICNPEDEEADDEGEDVDVDVDVEIELVDDENK